MTPKPIEPMPLDEVRERLRYTATSQVSTWEPADVARMRVTFEALVAVYAEAQRPGVPTWQHLRKLVDAVVATKPPAPSPMAAVAEALREKARAEAAAYAAGRLSRCLVIDEIPHSGVVGGYLARRCTLRAAHDGPCVFGEP